MSIFRGRIVVEGDVPRPVVALTVRPNIDAGPPYVHPYTGKSNDPGARFNIQSDGYFTLDLPEGRHRLRVDGFPDSLYRLKSVQYGSANLKDGLLQIGGGNPKELLITFTSTPDSSWTSEILIGWFDKSGPGFSHRWGSALRAVLSLVDSI